MDGKKKELPVKTPHMKRLGSKKTGNDSNEIQWQQNL